MARHLEMPRKIAGQSVLPPFPVKTLLLPVAPIHEQRRIVEHIKAAFAHTDALAAKAVRATALLDRLDQATLAKAFRGELLTNGTAT